MQTLYRNTIFIFVLCLLGSCTPKHAYRSSISLDFIPKTDYDTVMVALPLPKIESFVVKNRVEEILYYGKTACYGECPVFFLKIFSDGTVIYNGIQNVEKKGIIRTTMRKERLSNLVAQIATPHFFRMAQNYPTSGRRVQELPNTILQINNKVQQHKVTNNHDAPIAFFEVEDIVVEQMEMLGLK